MDMYSLVEQRETIFIESSFHKKEEEAKCLKLVEESIILRFNNKS